MAVAVLVVLGCAYGLVVYGRGGAWDRNSFDSLIASNYIITVQLNINIILDHHLDHHLKPCTPPRSAEARVWQPREPGLVPSIVFVDIAQHTRVLEAMLHDLSLGEHLLLIGNP